MDVRAPDNDLGLSGPFNMLQLNCLLCIGNVINITHSLTSVISKTFSQITQRKKNRQQFLKGVLYSKPKCINLSPTYFLREHPPSGALLYCTSLRWRPWVSVEKDLWSLWVLCDIWGTLGKASNLGWNPLSLQCKDRGGRGLNFWSRKDRDSHWKTCFIDQWLTEITSPGLHMPQTIFSHHICVWWIGLGKPPY